MAIAYLTDYMLGRDLYCHWLFVLSTTRALIQLSLKDIWAGVLYTMIYDDWIIDKNIALVCKCN